MSGLNNTSKQRIVTILADSHYGTECFQIVFSEEGNALVHIEFSPRPSYTFFAYEYESPIARASFLANGGAQKRMLRITMKPGDFKLEDDLIVEDFEDICTHLQSWSRRIRYEMTSSPPHIEVNDIVEEMFPRKADEIPEVSFASAEVDDIHDRLSEFERRMLDVSEKLEISEQELSNLRRIVSELQNDAKRLNQREWYLLARGRLGGWTRKVVKNKEFILAGIEIVKKLLS